MSFDDDLKVDLKTLSHDDRALELLRRDFSILTKGTEGKKLEDINLDAVMEFLDMLKTEVQELKDGMRGKDHVWSYCSDNPELYSFIFSKEQKVSGDDERGIE